jgi:hypothetical protein
MHYNGNSYMIMQRPATWGVARRLPKLPETTFLVSVPISKNEEKAVPVRCPKYHV